MTADPRKIRKLDEMEKLEFDAATQKALEEIDACQNEISEIDEKASMEIIVIERKYHQERRPWYEKRAEFISQIPNFWPTAIMNHPDLNCLFDDAAENCLHHLLKLEVQEFEDVVSGYAIKFYFEENPYFQNDVLSKEYLLNFDIPKSESSPIIWKEGYNLCHTTEIPKTSKKRRNDSGKNFFAWYMDNVDPVMDDVAEFIKDDLWINPLQYYLVPDNVDGDESATDGDDGSSSSEADEPKEEEDIKSGNNRK